MKPLTLILHLFTFFLFSLAFYAESATRQFTSKPPAHFFTLQPAGIDKGNRSGLEIAREALAWDIQRTGFIRNQIFSPVSLHSSAAVLSGKTHVIGSPMELQAQSKAGSSEMGWLTHQVGIVGLNPASWDVASANPGAFGSAPHHEDVSAGAVQERLDWNRRSDQSWSLTSLNIVQTSWQQRFYALPPSRAPRFWSLLDTHDRIPMIGTNQYLANVDLGDAQLTEIPLEAEGLSFFVVIPKSRGNFVALIEEGRLLNAKFWENAFQRLGEAQLENTKVILPKFSIQSGLEMRAPSPMTTAPSSIQQVNLIEMNERGFHTKRRSPMDGIGNAEVEREEQRQVIADQPFFFAIGSRGTGALLFVGQVVSP